jgi:hypothetical protein
LRIGAQAGPRSTPIAGIGAFNACEIAARKHVMQRRVSPPARTDYESENGLGGRSRPSCGTRFRPLTSASYRLLLFAYVPNEAFVEWPQILPQDRKKIGSFKSGFSTPKSD